MDDIVSNFGTHLTVFFAGATGMGLLAHAVNTFPPPENAYAKWLLGTIQWLVGQRMQSQRTFSGDMSTPEQQKQVPPKP